MINSTVIPIMPKIFVNKLFLSWPEILLPFEKISIITAVIGTIIMVIPCANMMSSKGSAPKI